MEKNYYFYDVVVGEQPILYHSKTRQNLNTAKKVLLALNNIYKDRKQHHPTDIKSCRQDDIPTTNHIVKL